MQEANELSSQEQENLAGQVMDSMGEGSAEAEEAHDADSDTAPEELPEFAKQTIGKLKKRHARDMRSMERKLNDLHSRVNGALPTANTSYQQMQQQNPNPFPNEAMSPGGIEDLIHKGVNMALQHRDMQEQKAKDAEKMAHVNRQYESLHERLDQGSDKYDDFDEVVRSQNAPFSEAMRDAALLIPNPEDVLYKLGKNKDELKRISALHPLEQAKEMVKLSVALMGLNGKSESQTAPKTIGQIKSNPVSHQGTTDKTPVKSIRQRMKDGDWK